MNKIMLVGKLIKDPEISYSQDERPIVVAKYELAVKKSLIRPDQPHEDFFNIIALGKSGEFAKKFFKNGQKVAIIGRLQSTDLEGQQIDKSIDIIVEEQYFV